MKTQTSAALGAATVLVVDDQTASRSIITELLQNITPKVSIIQKSHPQEALDWAVHHPADLVLVDYMMPDMNGIHFTKVLRTIQTYQYIPIVMVTIVDDKQTKQEALEAGVTDFLCKPLNLQECITRCQNLLSMQQQQTNLSEERIELEHALSQAKQTINTIEHEAIQLLLHLAYRDINQLQRAQRVARYAKLLGEVCGLNPQQQSEIEQASMLFELQTIQTQSDNSTIKEQTLPTCAQLLSQSHSPLFKMAADIAKYYGDHYSQGALTPQHKGASLPLSARIVAIAANFDQLSYPYSNMDSTELSPVANALARLASQSGVEFDPFLVKQLISIRPRLEKVYEDYLVKTHP